MADENLPLGNDEGTLIVTFPNAMPTKIESGGLGFLNEGHAPQQQEILPTDHLSFGRIAHAAGMDDVTAPLWDHERPEAEQPKPVEGGLSPAMRAHYAEALTNNETHGPQDFAEAFHGTLLKTAQGQSQDPNEHTAEARRANLAWMTNSAKALGQQLPTNEALIDTSIAIAHDAGVPKTPGMINLIRDNLAWHWAETGQQIQAAYTQAKADPELQAALLRPKPLGAYFANPEPEPARQQTSTIHLGIQAFGAAQELAAWLADTKLYEPPPPPPEATAEGAKPPPKPKKLRDLAPEVQAKVKADGITAVSLAFEPVNHDQNWQEFLKELGLGVAEGVVATYALMGAGKVVGLVAQSAAVKAALAYAQNSRAAELVKDLWWDEAGAPAASAALLRGQRIESNAARDAYKATIREARGTIADRENEAAAALLEQYRKTMTKHLPDYERWLQRTKIWADNTFVEKITWLANGGNAQYFVPSVPAPAKGPISHLIDYIEGRSAGAQLHPLAAPFRPFADAFRDMMLKVRAQLDAHIETTARKGMPKKVAKDTAVAQQAWIDNWKITHGKSFIEDYYRHLWERSHEAAGKFGIGREGSTSSMKARDIPTLSEGIEAGLTPKIRDPIDNALHYMTGIRSYLATQKVQELMHADGKLVWSASNPGAGWVALNGRASGKPVAAGVTMNAWAPKGGAAVYNNWIGRGFYDYPVVGAIYDKMLYVTNMFTAAKLALSGYHAYNIAKETMAAALTKAIGSIKEGQLTHALTDIGKTVPLPIVESVAGIGKALSGSHTPAALSRGGQLGQQYLRIEDFGPHMENLAKLYAEAGGRVNARTHRGGGADTAMLGPRDTIPEALRNGTYWAQVKQEIKNVAGREDESILPSRDQLGRLVQAPFRALGVFGNELGRVGDTMMSPMFDHMIPNIKRAVWLDEVEGWMRAHPLASRAEQQRFARTALDSVDFRFGEMIQDNLFWNRFLKQTLNLYTVSLGWEYGSLAAFGRGFADLGTGKLTPQARWVLSYPMIVAAESAIYQYGKTGTLPGNTQEWWTPRSGGQTLEGKDWLVLKPGYEKEPLEVWKAYNEAHGGLGGIGHAVAQYVENKENPGVEAMRATGEYITNGWLQRKVYDRGHDTDPVGWGLPNGTLDFMKKIKELATPITLSAELPHGHNLGVEQYLGFRPAAQYFVDPERRMKGIEIGERKAREEAERFERAHNRRLENPKELPTQNPLGKSNSLSKPNSLGKKRSGP